MAWARACLADVTEIVSGATPKTSVDAFWDGEVPWATPKDLSNLKGAYIDSTPRTITAEGLASCGANVLPAGSVLFSSRAPIGHVAINTVPMATNQGFKSLVPKPGRLDAKYLFHWLRANRPYLESLGNGATFKEVSKAVVSRVEIPLPSLEEQRRIAAILDGADALRAKRREAFALLDDLVQSIFIDTHRSFTGEDARFEDVCHRVTVGVVIKPASYYVETGIPALRTTNIKAGSIDLSDLVYFSEASNEGPLKKSKLRTGDLVIARTGKPGTTAQVPPALAGANAIDLIVATPNRERALPDYLEALMNSRLGTQIVAGEKRGQIQQHFNVGSLKSALIPVPDLAAQRAFAARVESVRMARRALTSSWTALDSLFASLQARAFSGRL